MTDTHLPGVHFTAPYLLNPLHRIKVDLIGAGGSGSQMLSALARIDTSLRALGRTGLRVTVWDPDRVEQPNIGRQLFSPSELGQNKAVALVSRFNRFFGLDWKAEPRLWQPDRGLTFNPNIIVSCVDNLDARKTVAKKMRDLDRADLPSEYRTWYWLDLGNAQKTGQAVLGSVTVPQPTPDGMRTVGRLPIFTDRFDVDSIDESDSGPSCSMAEALQKQSLFINSTLVQLSGHLLWSLLHDGCVEYGGFWLNLETLSCLPMEL